MRYYAANISFSAFITVHARCRHYYRLAADILQRYRSI
jgi:hypothetical protein